MSQREYSWENHDLPDGYIGIGIINDPNDKSKGKTWHPNANITPREWRALFWDELGAEEPNFELPNWREKFSESIPEYPNLSKVLGEYGTSVIFEGEKVLALKKECERIVLMTHNVLALSVVTRIVDMCELAIERNTSVIFMGD